MSFKNNLIRLAKEGRQFIQIRPSEVNKVIDHIRTTRWISERDVSNEAMRDMIFEGKVKILGAKIEVLGRKASLVPTASGWRGSNVSVTFDNLVTV